ncbi:DNA mismatch repair protein MutS [Prosthecochloris vibrioformis]|uniref:DNA mismatch repair protein MutS n=1 Tax=Prosthecochloris vibrioformis TaxID=1098 RepID=A0A5C4S1C9_PROVB|nr:DNA mismatch repair protein MutS [Prosthecochloris vibrioformis]TNJ37260.1 DNA mismatch repair protein MutS [Prosthecochloris vibrioformis]
MGRKPKGTSARESTPMMRQYLAAKEQYKDFLLLFRVGDFYESFHDDARQVSEAINIVLTRRSNGGASEIPMAGFPFHAAEGYIAKLVQKGFKVAICDQVEDPSQAKGIVRREITDIVTPGVTYSEKILDGRQNNWLCSVAFSGSGRQKKAGIAFMDVTTAEFRIVEPRMDSLADMLQSIQPSEVLVSSREKGFRDALRKMLGSEILVTLQDEWMFTPDNARQILQKQFRTHSLKGFGIERAEAGSIAAAVILQYLEETQRQKLQYITRISLLDDSKYMTLDLQTRRNLEIVSSMQDGSEQGSLFRVVDHTCTPMGSRLLKNWLLHPLRQKAPIELRLDAVGELLQDGVLRGKLREMLKGMHDMERALARIATGRSVPREVLMMGKALEALPGFQSLLSDVSSRHLAALSSAISPLPDLARTISQAIDPEAGAGMREGGFIRSGCNDRLDELRSLSSHARERLLEIQQQERQRTSISTLKVQYNKVFGYYIEVSKANRDKVPDDYEKKQTLVNAERYTIPALKEYESAILTAEEEGIALELELFRELSAAIAKEAGTLQADASLVAELDCLASFAVAAEAYGYCKPLVTEGRGMRITEGRHPVLERILGVDEAYVANDCSFDEQERMRIVTGPNMAGKSSYLRQIGLITLLAQVGSFVPAASAEIGLVDRIFTRVGASDNLASGESTFLVEMHEAASILNNATPDSLILLDEVGRGTSTFDGMSIAWAMSEYIHTQLGARTLFATHYHELAELEERFAGIYNYNATVTESGDKVIFLRRIVRGASDNSYGIEVARMAGMPSMVIERAKELLAGMEKKDIEMSEHRSGTSAALPTQIYLFEEEERKLRRAIERLDLDRMTPIDALIELRKLQELASGEG